MTEWRRSGLIAHLDVSSHGEIRITRPRLAKNGPWPGVRILRQYPTKDGYREVSYRLAGKAYRFYVHRLVCEAFHGPPPFARADARHKDGVPHHNSPDNLAWGTRLENVNDARGHGTLARGERIRSARLTADQVRAIRRNEQAGVCQAALAQEYGVSQSTISMIVTGRRWGHVEMEEAKADVARTVGSALVQRRTGS